MIWIFLYGFLEIFPRCLLWYLPFRKRLRVQREWVQAGLIALVVIQALVYMMLKSTGTLTLVTFLPYLCVFGALHIGLLVLCCNVSLSKIVFVVLLTVPYGVMVQDILHWIEIMLLIPKNYALLSLVRAVLTGLAYPPAAWFLRRFVAPAMPVNSKEIWQGAWGLPCTFAACALLMSFSPVGITEYGSMMLLVRVILAFGSAFSCYHLVRAQRNVEVRAELLERVRFSESLVSLEKQQYIAFAELMREHRTERHDFRHHLSVIRTLAERGETEQLCIYLQSYAATAPQEAEPAVCENPIANVVLGHYLSLARTQCIAVDCDLQLEHDVGVSDTDLCVLLGNLLENAIEACQNVPEAQRFIRVRSGRMGDGLYLTLDNSYDGVLQEHGGHYQSRKIKQRPAAEITNEYRVGLGLSSVQALVNRYNGVLKIQHTETAFMISVMLETVQEVEAGVNCGTLS